MKIVLPGGSGQVGASLGDAFHAAGHEVVELSRSPREENPWRVVKWDARTAGSWVSELEKADVVINLAGRNVNCRYTRHNRRSIMQSRVDSTRVIGQAIAAARNPPRIWLQAGTATIYAHRFDQPNDERSGTIGGGEPEAPDSWRFSIAVAKAWENEVAAVSLPKTRKVILRSAMIMSPNKGGVFDVLLRLVRFGLGGTAGNGHQYVSWIHEADFIRAIYWIIEHSELAGAINLAAPHPLPNREFMRELRRSWGMPIGLPATAAMLEIGAFFLRTETELILKSRRVVPGRLLESGFTFHHGSWTEAARDLCRQVRKGKRTSESIQFAD